MKMGRIPNVVLALSILFHICLGNGRRMNEQELGEFLNKFYSHYAPSNSRDQRDLTAIPPGTSMYQEPSFRDLDVGIGIGVKDDDSDLLKQSASSYSLNNGYLSQDQSKEITFGVYADPRNGVSYYLPQAVQSQLYSGVPQQSAIFDPKVNLFGNSQPANFIMPSYSIRAPTLVASTPQPSYYFQPVYGYGTPIPSNAMQYPLDYSAQRVSSAPPYFVPTEQNYRQEMSAQLPYFIQPKTPAYGSPAFQAQPLENVNAFPYPAYGSGGRTFRKFFEVEENRPYYRRDQLYGIPRGNVALTPRSQPAQVIVDPQQGLPVMTAEPYGERQVGAFRLRNDHGYQVMMNVPRLPEDGPSDGVLVMEMKATLYRPIQ